MNKKQLIKKFEKLIDDIETIQLEYKQYSDELDEQLDDVVSSIVDEIKELEK